MQFLADTKKLVSLITQIFIHCLNVYKHLQLLLKFKKLFSLLFKPDFHMIFFFFFLPLDWLWPIPYTNFHTFTFIAKIFTALFLYMQFANFPAFSHKFLKQFQQKLLAHTFIITFNCFYLIFASYFSSIMHIEMQFAKIKDFLRKCLGRLLRKITPLKGF